MIQKEKDAQVFAVEKTLEQNKQQADGHLIRNSKTKVQIPGPEGRWCSFKDKQVKTKDKGIPIKTVRTYSLGGYIRGRVKGSAADSGLLCGRWEGRA